MTPKPASLRSPRTGMAAFSLTEIVIALAIISVAMVAIIGVLPAGLTAAREATDHSVVASILENVNHRLRNEKLEADRPSFSPIYFDERGQAIPDDAPDAELKRRLYRADVSIGEWETPPAHTSGLKAVSVAISWPVSGNGEPVGPRNPRTTVSYGVTTLAGPEWRKIDPQFEPKIEF